MHHFLHVRTTRLALLKEPWKIWDRRMKTWNEKLVMSKKVLGCYWFGGGKIKCVLGFIVVLQPVNHPFEGRVEHSLKTSNLRRPRPRSTAFDVRPPGLSGYTSTVRLEGTPRRAQPGRLKEIPSVLFVRIAVQLFSMFYQLALLPWHRGDIRTWRHNSALSVLVHALYQHLQNFQLTSPYVEQL